MNRSAAHLNEDILARAMHILDEAVPQLPDIHVRPPRRNQRDVNLSILSALTERNVILQVRWFLPIRESPHLQNRVLYYEEQCAQLKSELMVLNKQLN